MTMTWNNSTSWATSAKDETESTKFYPPSSESPTVEENLTQTGLTKFGKQVVKRMNELGMLVDLSHVGEQTFWDAITTTTKACISFT